MMRLFERLGRWRRQLDALVQHASSRATAEGQMALDLSRLLEQQKRTAAVIEALVDVVASQNMKLSDLADQISKLQAAPPAPVTDPAEQAAVDAAAAALSEAADKGEATVHAPAPPPTTEPPAPPAG